jgi:hemerythrin superfamily protein
MKKKSSNSKRNLKAKKTFTGKDKTQPVKAKDDNSKDITALILRDHQPIKKLIFILKDPKVGIAKKRPAYAEFEKILSKHAKAEEETLYNHMKKDNDLRIEGLEGDVEHFLADQLMKEINHIENEDAWMAKVKVLSELVDHHVKEEEKEVLKQIRKGFDLTARIEIGKEYSQKLNQLQEDEGGKMKFTEQNNTLAEHVNLNTDNKKSEQKPNLKSFINNISGRIAVPILLYFLGVPGFFVIVIWALFFRGN